MISINLKSILIQFNLIEGDSLRLEHRVVDVLRGVSRAKWRARIHKAPAPSLGEIRGGKALFHPNLFDFSRSSSEFHFNSTQFKWISSGFWVDFKWIFSGLHLASHGMGGGLDVLGGAPRQRAECPAARHCRGLLRSLGLETKKNFSN